MPTFSLLSLIFFVLFSLFLLSFSSALSSLQTQTPSSSQYQHHTSQWLIFFFWWVMIRRVLWFFFFFAVIGALRKRWVWLKWVVGCDWVRGLGCWSWLGSMFGLWLGYGWSGLLVIGDRWCLGLVRSWRDRRGSRWWVWWRSTWVTAGLAGSSGFCLSDGFFFFFFNIGFCSGGILVGSRQWWCGGHGGGAVVVTRQWRRGDRGWGKVEEKIEKKRKKEKIYFIT